MKGCTYLIELRETLCVFQSISFLVLTSFTRACSMHDGMAELGAVYTFLVTTNTRH